MDRYQIIRIIHDYMSIYDKKKESGSQKMYSAAALFRFLLWVVFSLHPYLNGFILPSIRFLIFR